MRMNFGKTLLVVPIWRRPAIKGNKLLPKPLQPTQTCSQTTTEKEGTYCFTEK